MANVEIYTTRFCPYCIAARRLLNAKGVTFTEHDVTMDRAGRAAMTRRAGGRTSVPQIFIGDLHVGGSDELHALERGGRLDALLAQVATT